VSRSTIHEQIITNYKIYSENYWIGVRVRQLEYRRKQKLAAEQYLAKPKLNVSFQPTGSEVQPTDPEVQPTSPEVNASVQSSSIPTCCPTC